MEFCRIHNISIARDVNMRSFKGLIAVYLTTLRIIIGKGCRRKSSWPNVRYYPGICPEGLKKTIKKLQSE
jgi:hypothetical protein